MIKSTIKGLACLIMALSFGCASLQAPIVQNAAELATKGGTAKLIDGDVDRAVAVREISSEVLGELRNTDIEDVDAVKLRQTLNGVIPYEKLDEGNREVAKALVNTVTEQILREVREFEGSESERKAIFSLTVQSVLGWVNETAIDVIVDGQLSDEAVQGYMQTRMPE